jgi:hypothetical protein
MVKVAVGGEIEPPLVKIVLFSIDRLYQLLLLPHSNFAAVPEQTVELLLV